MCGNVKYQVIPSLASRTSSCIDDDRVFLMMSIIKSNKNAINNEIVVLDRLNL